MLYEVVKNALPQALPCRANYQPFPRYENRSKWQAIPQEIKAYYKDIAESLQQTDLLAALPAVRYMDYARNGNRTRYEKLHFARRANMMSLVIAECIEGNGTYLDDIINLIWAICEETSWCIPAHNGVESVVDALPDVEAQMCIDLFSAETGSALAWTYYLLSAQLSKQSPLIPRRIELEVKRRILDPYLEYDNYWWMGFIEGMLVNNWNPWVNSSVSNAFLVLEPDEQRRQAAILKCAKSLDRFIDVYFPDGGCDEGPAYFGVAGGALFDCLEALHSATNGSINIYNEPVIQNMAKYIYRVHVHNDYFVNFADAPARVDVPVGLLLRVGKYINDDMLCEYSRYMLANSYAGIPYRIQHSCLYRAISNILTFESIAPADVAYTAPSAHYFEGIQVMAARHKDMFLACKGGHNAESHNHNDIGNFVLYIGGRPIIIDAGVEAYSRKTFSNERYDIWTMRSDFHNTPSINGYAQKNGQTFGARNIYYNSDEVATSLSMDIASAYPAESAVESYKRCICMDRKRNAVTITDSFNLKEVKVPIAMHFMCKHKPHIADNGISICDTLLCYDKDMFSVAIEPIPLTDEKIAADWQQDTLYKLVFVMKKQEASGKFEFVFEDGRKA